MPETTPKPTRRYAAFVSYRHADNRDDGRRWAEWLHQSLETYEVPRALAGKPNLRGAPVPNALYPVFRDEEELSADADLSQNLRRALENTEVLIVLCSPRASESPFVAEEIRYFKELGRSDRILALMIDGEPNADDPAKAAQGVTPAMECFPEPLRFGVPVVDPAGGPARIDWTQRTEPLAADVRPQNRAGQGYTSGHAYRVALEKEGKRSHAEIRRLEKDFAAQLDLARLKLVAGALGLPLGQLRERDAAYRAKKFRRLAAILGSLALLALVAAGVAVWQGFVARQQQVRAEAGEKAAVAARERAVASKKAADELIRFMQYDLRDTLGKLGALNMMDGINARIRRYHEEHPPEPGDQDARDADDRERTAALDQQGDILLARGQLDESLKAYQSSLAIHQRLVAKSPANDAWQTDLAIGFDNLGNVQKAKGDLTAALKSFQDSLAIRLGLVEHDPDNSEWSSAVATSSFKIGGIHQAMGNLTAALKAYEDELAIRRGLADANAGNTDWRRSLSVSLDKVGGIHEARGELPAALALYEESLQTIQELAAGDPANTVWQRDLSISLDKIGNLQKAKGDLTASFASYQSSLDIRQKLSDKDPANSIWQRDLSISFDKIGHLERLQGDGPAALRSFQSNLVIARRLAAQDPANADWQHDVAIGLDNVGNMQQFTKDAAGSLRSHEESLAIFRKLTAQDPANAVWQRDVSISLSYIGDVKRLLNDLPGALQSFQDALAVTQKLAAQEPTNTGWQMGLASEEKYTGEILYALKRTGEARGHYVRCRDILDRLSAAHPGIYGTEAERVHALWCLSDCVDPKTPDGRAEGRKLLGEALDILRALENAGPLRRVQVEWRQGIEKDLKEFQ